MNNTVEGEGSGRKRGRCLDCSHLLRLSDKVYICDVYDGQPYDIKTVQPCKFYKKREDKPR
jgi:hypothetical protein